jgi:Leucine-rich repeat (LRR) protein
MSALFKIPDELWYMVVEFATYNLRQMLGLQLVSTYFRRVMSNPLMIAHLSVELEGLVHSMGFLQHGVRYLKAAALPASAPLELLSGFSSVRCLNLSYGQFEAGALELALESLRHLEQLDLSFCQRLVELHALPATLRALDVMYCSRLVALPALPNLEKLDASHCRRLCALPNLPALSSVELGYGPVRFVPNNTLRHLQICQTNAPDAHQLTNLDSLCLVDCNFEQHEWMCAPLANLRALTLVFVSYRKAHDLSRMTLLTGLQKLHLEIGVSDDNLVSLEALVNLKALVIGSELISDIGLVSIGKMRSLETLYINNCRRTQITSKGLVALAPLENLFSLHLSECYGVQYDMQGLSTLVQLRTLCIDNDSNLGGRWPVTPEEAMMDYMVHEDDLQPLVQLSNLTVLELLYCGVMGLAWLNQIPRLEILVVKGCPLTIDGLWDLMPCTVQSVILGENTRATLGDDVDQFRQSMAPHAQLSFESECM